MLLFLHFPDAVSDATINQEPEFSMTNNADTMYETFSKIFLRRKNTIKKMSADVQHLKDELQLTITQKFDALSRLEKIERMDQMISLKEKQTEWDVVHLNNSIKSLTDELSKSKFALEAARKELETVSVKFEADGKEKSNQLRETLLITLELSEKNELLKMQNMEYAFELQDRLNETNNRIAQYDNDLKAKTKLIEMYRKNDVNDGTFIDKLVSNFAELKQLLEEVVEQCGILETDLQQSEMIRKIDSVAYENEIRKLKTELQNANAVLMSNCQESQNGIVDHQWTYTELNSLYVSATQQFQSEDAECRILETELTNLIKNVEARDVDFEQNQIDLECLKAENDQLIEEAKTFLVERDVVVNELEDNRERCKILQDENDKMKSLCNECMHKFPVNVSNSSSKLDMAKVEEQNQTLLVIVNDLLVKHHEMLSVNNIPANGSTVSVCNKSVEMTENDLSIENNLNANGDANRRTEKEDLLIIEELSNEKRKLENKISELSFEKSFLADEMNSLNAQYNSSKTLTESLNEQNQAYVNTIKERLTANNHLRNEIGNTKSKLLTSEANLRHSESQVHSLENVTSRLVAEAEALQEQIIQENVLNRTLRRDLEMVNATANGKLLSVMNQRHEANRLRDVPSIVQVHRAVQVDFDNEIIAELNQDSEQAPICDTSPSTNSDPERVIAPVKKGSKRKRIAKTAEYNAMNPPLKKKRLNSSGDSDGERVVDVCSVDSDIRELLLADARTRKQVQFVNEALNG